MAGSKKFKWRGKEAVRVAKKAAMEALRVGGEKILTDAIDNAPVDTGTLRRSGTVTTGGLSDFEQVYSAAKGGSSQEKAFPHSQPVGSEDAVYVSFNTPYALRQHEELDYNHPRGGDAKYLERAFNLHKRKIKKMVDLRVKKALRDAR